jgi:putative ABC transport system permease protein
MATLLQDIRYAIRLLLRSPGFALTSIATLALAIGANAAIFSAVRGILIAPLPYPEPDRLVRLFEESLTTPHFPLAPADFRDYRAELRTFEGLAAYFRNDLQLAEGGQPEQLRGMQVTSGFFTLVGHQPTLGRDFSLNDELPGNEGVVVLSHGLWMRRFNADPDIVGKPVRLSGRMFTVVGVLPEGFRHVGGTYRTYGHEENVDIWSVLPVPRGNNPGDRFSHYFNVVGRVRPGVSPAEMEADLRVTGQSVAKRYPAPNSPWSAKAVPLKSEIVGASESTLVSLSAAAAVVLILACVNVAGLLLGRATARGREIGVRAALGATRVRLMRQLLIESVVLASIGGALGVGLSYLGVALLARYGPSDTPRLQMIGVDEIVLGYTLLATMLSALLFGLAPALQLARAGVGDTLKQGSRSVAGGAHQQMRRVLVGVEVALAFVLVVSNGLLVRSFLSMLNTDPGFQPQGAITASIELPKANYPTDADTGAFFARTLERIRALPGVREAGFGSDLPWTGYDENTGFGIVGRQTTRDDEPEGRYHFITAGYAAATGVPVIAGRDITTSDDASASAVVVVNESLARKYWSSPNDAVGARIRLWGHERSIAGVIGDVRDMPWHPSAIPALYFPQPQQWYPQRMLLVVRSEGADAGSLVESIRRAVKEIDPALPLASVMPLESVAGAAIGARRLTLWLVGTFGVTALFLAVVGIYGVMAQAVRQRTHEFGVRQALGATERDIMRLVMSSGAILTTTGLVIGALLSLAATRLFASMLYSVSATDPGTFVAVTLLLIAAAFGAIYLPARRATRVSPANALRTTE